MEPGGSCLQQFGTKKGLNFLDENQKIGVKFIEYLGKFPPFRPFMIFAHLIYNSTVEPPFNGQL